MQPQMATFPSTDALAGCNTLQARFCLFANLSRYSASLDVAGEKLHPMAVEVAVCNRHGSIQACGASESGTRKRSPCTLNLGTKK